MKGLRNMRKQSIKKATIRVVSLLLTVIIITVGLPFNAVAYSSTPAPEYVATSTDKALWAEGTTATTTNNIDAVKWHKKNNTYYWFLPSSADLSSLTVYHNFNNVAVNGISITSGNSYNMFENGKTYTVTADGNEYSLCVQKANGIGSMFLTTESGGMRKIHSNKEIKESGQLVAIDYDGSVSYDNALDYIKGRGNTTWNLAKKPYNIKLDKKASLLGMDKNKKWCLLANAQDHSMIRNTLMYNLADEIGLEYSPDSRFVDLYANGLYLGTYQLTQKVEAGEGDLVDITDLEAKTEEAVANGTGVTDVDIEEMYGDDHYVTDLGGYGRKAFNIPYNPDDITGGYLIEFVMTFDEQSYFLTNRYQAIQVKNPEYCSAEQINYIADFMQDLEDAVYSETGYNSKGKHYSEYVDVESAALMYLLQEFAVNIDGGISSCYFYKESDITGDGKLHASPAWDFDVALGNLDEYKDWSHTMDYSEWFIKHSFAYSEYLTIFGQLCQHDDFWLEVENLYTEKFLPALNILTGKTEGTGRLKSMYYYDALLEPSSIMNYTRWKLETTLLVPETGYTQDEQMQYLENFINGRIEFLNSNLCIDNVKETQIIYLDNLLARYEEKYSNGIAEEQQALEEITAIIEKAKIDIVMATVIDDVYDISNNAMMEVRDHMVTIIYFDNSKAKWDNVYIYGWEDEWISPEDGVVHEGRVLEEKMTYAGDDLYQFVFKGRSAMNVIFNNGEIAESGNRHQTQETSLVYTLYLDYSNIYIAQPNEGKYDTTEQAYIHNGKWSDMFIRGDANENCEVDLMDAVLIMKHLLGTYEFSEFGLASADVDYNDEVELLDAVNIQKYILGLIDEFPDDY